MHHDLTWWLQEQTSWLYVWSCPKCQVMNYEVATFETKTLLHTQCDYFNANGERQTLGTSSCLGSIISNCHVLNIIMKYHVKTWHDKCCNHRDMTHNKIDEILTYTEDTPRVLYLIIANTSYSYFETSSWPHDPAALQVPKYVLVGASLEICSSYFWDVVEILIWILCVPCVGALFSVMRGPCKR